MLVLADCLFSGIRRQHGEEEGGQTFKCVFSPRIILLYSTYTHTHTLRENH